MTEKLDLAFIPKITPTELPNLAVAMAKSGLALMLYGSPGIGKTALIQAMGKHPKLVAWSNSVSGLGLVEMPVVTLSAPELNVEDLLGVPTVEDLVRRHADGSTVTHKVTKWAIPAALDPTQPFILFIDEPNRCDPSVRNALFQLITGRTTSTGFAIPPGSLACMAGNRMEDRAGVRSLDTAFSNRCGHFELMVDPEAWLDWASVQPDFSPLVRAFITRHLEHLCKFDPAHPAPQQATPRTWAALGFSLSEAEAPLRRVLVQGLVGTESAQLFQAFLEHAQIVPHVQDIIDHPDRVRIPSSGQLDEAYIFALAVADFLMLTRPPAKNISDPLGRGVGLVLGRLVNNGFEEVAMMAVRRIFRLDGNRRKDGVSPRMLAAMSVLATHPRFGEFVKKLQDLSQATGFDLQQS